MCAMTGFCGRQLLVILHPVTMHSPTTKQFLLEVTSQKNSPVDSPPDNVGKLSVVLGNG